MSREMECYLIGDRMASPAPPVATAMQLNELAEVWLGHSFVDHTSDDGKCRDG